MWDPAAARRGVSVERQTFVIDLQTGKFAHVFHAVPAVGHAAAVRDVLEALLLSKDAARNPAATASASPATAPAPAQPQAPAPLAAAPVSLKPPAPKPSAPKDPLPKPSASSESQPALPPRSTGAQIAFFTRDFIGTKVQILTQQQQQQQQCAQRRQKEGAKQALWTQW